VTLQASHSLTTTNFATQVTTLINAFNNATTALNATPVSDGSDTVDPTNDDISIHFADILA
jgi:hypothetical protein